MNNPSSTGTMQPIAEYSALFEALSCSSFLLQSNVPMFTILEATPSILQQTSNRKEDLIGKGIFEAFPSNPQDEGDTGQKNLRASLQHVLEHKSPHYLPLQRYDVVGADGQFAERYWEASNKPVLDAAGNVQFIIHSTTDITDRVKAEQREEDHQELRNMYQQLQASQEEMKRFKFMADNAQDAFILMRQDGSFAYLNQKALDAWGYANCNETLQLKVPDVDPMYDSPAFNELFTRAQNSTIPQFESLHKRKDGHVFPVELTVNGITLDGQIHMLAIVRDISERRKQEVAFEAQSVLIRTITDNATSTLFMMNADGYATFMNAAGEKMFGYTQEEIRSKPLHYLIHHHRPDGSLYPMEECPLDRALPENFDVRAHKDLFFRKDGTSFPITCAASPIFENGKPVATVIEVRDVTLEMEAEQALRRSAAELEQLVTDRTKDLVQLNEQLQQFAYAASHDLQEPLRKINFFLHRLLSNIAHTLTDDNKKIVERIELTIKRMQNLINDLLDYSNSTLGVTGFNDVQLEEVVQQVMNDMEATIIQSNAVIEVGDLPAIKGDNRQLQQMFQNLLSNALKYQNKDLSPHITINGRLATQEEKEPYVSLERKNLPHYLLEVKDNGIGFNAENAERIFLLFQRLHGKSEYEGTGVGLAIVQKVVENHKGYIWAESEPGQGATFKIMLPRV